ncbi:putative bifunctional diguanylate cyclase/phosphodiesterase [Qipengyuania flava]|uniref:putative bifunctional diguanylate cyclase/phosphodiesterase n=1 Tax=Qipengyuania flava TaxID=192812 RepID=UPI001C637670|nr:EAL domain-containing protein [Qipengyuania flava]QYJ06419.1 EAL domain-containing protein [Qipengyuania flava]
MGKQHINTAWARIQDLREGADPLTDQARGALVRSLYERRTALAMGAICGAMASTVVAFLSDNSLLYSLAFLLSSIAILRIVNARHLARNPDDIDADYLELTYKFGAFSYALVLGLVAAATVALDTGAMAQVLMITNAVGYGIGICAHNAARPTIALGQLTLVSVPVVWAVLAEGSVAGAFLALTIALLFPAMFSIVFSIFGTLRDSLDAADRSAELAAQMETIALTDPVTGLANRSGLDRDLPGVLERAADSGNAAVLWIDLDRFKEVNELKGHQAGDQVLREIGSRLSALVEDGGIVARFAGDEFVVTTRIDSRNAASMLASQILGEVRRPMRIDGERIEMGASIGIALMPEDGCTAEELMRHADLALYEAKIAGRSQVRFFTTDMTRDLAHRREIETELRLALSRDELSVYFQPIVDLETGRVRCFEALVRWFHPEKGEIRPDEFIPVAEDSGAIVTLGNWLTGEAARVAAQWPEDVHVAVNLSPLQLKAPGAALGILNALREAGLPPERLELEVTENLFLEDSPSIALFIKELSRAGVRFALDDFGTGYSSLAYINQWPFSKIKVDRSFVSGAQAGRKSDAIIRAVSQMGHTLGMEIVAEGLETVEQVKAVRSAGCTLGQGYHFSRAIPDYKAALLLAEETDSAKGELRKRRVG